MIETFFDKSEILDKSSNINFIVNKPKLEKESVLYPTHKHEGQYNGYYKLIKDTNNIYCLYYRGLNNPKPDMIQTQILTPYEQVFLAKSSDGIHWKQKKNKVCISEGTKLKKNNFCHNFFPILHPIENIYYAISGTAMYNKGLHLFKSKDGIDWHHKGLILDKTNILPQWHTNHFDSHNSLVFNPYDNFFYLFLRHNCRTKKRYVQMCKTKDFKTFTPVQEIIIENWDGNQIYNFNVFMYPNSNYFIAIPTCGILNRKNCHEKKSKHVLWSKDGLNWHYLTKNFIDCASKAYMFANGIGICNNKFLFYKHINVDETNNRIDLFTLDKDRIQSIECNDSEEGYITINKVIEKNVLKINYKTSNEGWVKLILSDNDDILFETEKLKGDELEFPINLKNIEFGNKYDIKIIIKNANLFTITI